MTISKFFALATVFIAAFTLGSCSKDDDEVNDSKADGHEYVDLGLPSGTLWATCNVGASKPEEYGSYFAWGETQSRKKYSWDDYKWGGLLYSPLTKYCIHSGLGTVDNRTELLPEDDAATANWGSSWRMPSSDQINELCNPSYTITEWTALNGVNGLKITSKKNGNSIFFSSHILSDIDEICDKMAVLHDGNTKFIGTPKEFREKYQSNNAESAFLKCISQK